MRIGVGGMLCLYRDSRIEPNGSRREPYLKECKDKEDAVFIMVLEGLLALFPENDSEISISLTLASPSVLARSNPRSQTVAYGTYPPSDLVHRYTP